MGKIKELQEKVAKGLATDEEVKELNELKAEAVEVSEKSAEVDAEVDKLADELVNKVESKMGSKLDDVLKAIKKGNKVKEEAKSVKYIVNKELGKVSVDELAEKKISVPGRKEAGKKVTEISMKSVEFVDALMTGNKEKLQLLTEGTAAAGGYLVPEEFANMIVEDIRDQSVMRQLAQSMTISTDTLHLPSLDSRPKAAWRSEAAVKATSTATFSELVFTPYSQAVIVGLSQELAADASLGVSGSIVNYVGGLMAQALRENEEKAFWTGNGSGKPTGVNNYSLAGRDAGGTDSSLADAIKKTYWDLPQGYRNGAVWVGHQQAWARVNSMKNSQNDYLLTMVADGPTTRLGGSPVYEQNDLPTDILLFGNFSYYQIVDRQGITVDFSTEATVAGSSAFEKNLVYVRCESRVDGELTLTNAVRKISGLN